ncbi:uncharacterized protein LOC125299723 [Alosa alosa]|uniref:uncharacterized protein LOC125299723 n=1 Tax=Alosa alosa TaxID=278164 RepID=UPI0020154C6E|nr:uncharacterized protein LOC125299723 [Alosa alosa]
MSSLCLKCSNLAIIGGGFLLSLEVRRCTRWKVILSTVSGGSLRDDCKNSLNAFSGSSGVSLEVGRGIPEKMRLSRMLRHWRSRIVSFMIRFLLLIEKLYEGNFTLDGERKFFDKNGDFEDGYDVVMLVPAGEIRQAKVFGRFALPQGKVVITEKNIMWTSTLNSTRGSVAGGGQQLTRGYTLGEVCGQRRVIRLTSWTCDEQHVIYSEEKGSPSS